MAKQPRVYATLGPFTFSHPHITSPDTEGKFADNKYKVDGIAEPKSQVMVTAQELITQCLKDFGLPKKGTQLCLKKEVDKNEAGKKVETGNLVLRTKSKFAPAVVDASGNPIPEKALKKMKIGAGSTGRIEGYFAPYTSTEKVRNAEGELETVETQGVNFTLTGIQLLKLVAGSTGGSSFGAYEGGGFTYEGADDADDDNTSGGLDIGSDADEDDDEGGLDI